MNEAGRDFPAIFETVTLTQHANPQCPHPLLLGYFASLLLKLDNLLWLLHVVLCRRLGEEGGFLKAIFNPKGSFFAVSAEVTSNQKSNIFQVELCLLRF